MSYNFPNCFVGGRTQVKRRALLLLAFVLFSWTASADDRSHEDDGPIAGRLGVVHFPISCDVSVQKPFERGVALLHSFWYEEARDSSSTSVKLPPNVQWRIGALQ
jgi:hypothetical protein